jgi:predicted RNA-binding protein
MANLINNQISYTVKNNGEWFYKSLQKAHTLQNDYIRVIPNVTKQVKLHKLVMANNTISQLDNRDCAWSPVQRITLNESLLQVDNYKINEEQCMEELDSVWSEMQYARIGATKDSWPSNTDGHESLESAVMFHLQNSLANDIERIIWGGTGNAVAGIQNGLIDKALASANTIKVTGQTIDATNVLGEIEKVYNAIPNVVLNDGEFDPEKAKVRIFVNMDIMRYLRQALSTVPTNYQVILPSFAIEGGKIFYMGVEIVVAGLPANTMFAASKDNIVFVTDLLSDTQEIRGQFGNDLKDEAMFYIKGAYRAAVGMVFEDEVVIYSV